MLTKIFHFGFQAVLAIECLWLFFRSFLPLNEFWLQNQLLFHSIGILLPCVALWLSSNYIQEKSDLAQLATTRTWLTSIATVLSLAILANKLEKTETPPLIHVFLLFWAFFNPFAVWAWCSTAVDKKRQRYRDLLRKAIEYLPAEDHSLRERYENAIGTSGKEWESDRLKIYDQLINELERVKS